MNGQRSGNDPVLEESPKLREYVCKTMREEQPPSPNQSHTPGEGWPFELFSSLYLPLQIPYANGLEVLRGRLLSPKKGGGQILLE